LQCLTCSRKADEQSYYKLHARVCIVIIRKYDLWRKANKISWKEYLSEIAKDQLAGD